VRSFSPAFGTVLVAVCALHCGAELPSPAVVTKLRLLAITTDTPELASPGPFRATAVWADGSPRAGRAVFFHWRACPVTSQSDPRACLLPSPGLDLASITESLDLDTSALPVAPALGAPPAQRWTLLLAMCPDQPPVYDAVNRQYVCPSDQSLPNEQREGIQAFRTLAVRVGATGDLQVNPSINRVTIDGMPLPTTTPLSVQRCARDADGLPACAGVPLALVPTEGSAQTGETLMASFFVSAGSVSRPRAVASAALPSATDGSLNTLWYPPAVPSNVRVWMVLHDGRGGDVATGPFAVTVR